MPELFLIHSVVIAGVVAGSFVFMKDENIHSK